MQTRQHPQDGKSGTIQNQNWSDKSNRNPGFRKNQPHHLQHTILCRSTHLPPFQILLDVQLSGSEKEKNHHGMEKNRTELQLRRHDTGLKRCRPSSPGPPRIRRKSSLRNRCH
ncbi:hypothetical protein quinque_008781 [Culex quinquefasciatus]